MTTNELIRRIKEQADEGVAEADDPWCIEIQHIIFEHEEDLKELHGKMEQQAQGLKEYYESEHSELWGDRK